MRRFKKYQADDINMTEFFLQKMLTSPATAKLKQESHGIARIARDAEAVGCGLKFTDIH